MLEGMTTLVSFHIFSILEDLGELEVFLDLNTNRPPHICENRVCSGREIPLQAGAWIGIMLGWVIVVDG